MRRFLPVLIFLWASFVQTVISADETGPAKDVPELQILQNYVGNWDVKVTGNEFTRGEDTAHWILGGRFLEQSCFIVSENGTNRVEITTLYTFDATKKTYRSWTFLSTGATSQADMTWDETTKTMTSVMRIRPRPHCFSSTTPNNGNIEAGGSILQALPPNPAVAGMNQRRRCPGLPSSRVISKAQPSSAFRTPES